MATEKLAEQAQKAVFMLIQLNIRTMLFLHLNALYSIFLVMAVKFEAFFLTVTK